MTATLERPSADRPEVKIATPAEPTKLHFRAMAERILRVVRSRRPKAFQVNPQDPNYLLAYVTEKLECGHEQDVQFIENVEPLIAKHRSCQECAALNKKKPSQSVRPGQKRQAGFSPWFSLGLAVLCASLLIVALSRTSRKTYTFKHPANYIRVVQNLDPCLPDGSCGYRFVVQSVVNGVAQPETSVRFCSSLRPRFEAGHVLSWIRYTNLGSCLSIDGYDVVRDASGLPVPARNCKPDYSSAPVAGHLACVGGRAKFD